MVDHIVDASAPRGRVEIRSGVGRRRRWSNADKGRIVAESFAPGAVVSVVARRHEISPQHLFAWRKAARHGELALRRRPGTRRSCRQLSLICVLLNLRRARLIDPIDAALDGPLVPRRFPQSTPLQHFQEPCEWQTRWQMSSPSSRRPNSARWIVARLTPNSRTRSAAAQRRRARAALI